MKDELSVGEMARRSGVPVSTLHFYEARGLLKSRRTAGNQRRYPRGLLRLVAIIRIAQRAGVSLEEIRVTLASLPEGRAPDIQEWKEFSERWKEGLEQRITALTQLRDDLQSCIGCGCLSTTICPLRNPDDSLGRNGVGAVLLQSGEAKAQER